MLDGAIRLNDLCTRAKEFGMNSVAVTDHGNMYAAVQFYKIAKKFDLKPIIGCEVYLAAGDHKDKTSDSARVRHHLVLLAKNINGYHNLAKLVTLGFTEGLYYKPRVSKELLRLYNEDVICLSACLAGDIPKAIRTGDMELAEKLALEYAEIYPDNFYLELQSNGLEEQEVVNKGLLELSKKTGLPLVATNDCHYLDASDYEAHDILLCIQTAAKVDDAKRMHFETKELYYKSPEEMAKAFAHVPEAISNTQKIADSINIEMELGKHYFPKYELPEGVTMETEFRNLAREGLKKRLATLPYRDKIDPNVYEKRLERELDVISGMGFPDYFLIVQDFINWAKDNKIPVGPGRGSAAGSIVAWSLRITNLDPLPYNLIFERFLNDERVSLPDIDVDFCERRRTEVIDYVGRKYGKDSVSQIIAFGTMKAKAVVRDVGRALGFTFPETNRIAKLIPEDLKMTIKKAMEIEPELKALYTEDKGIRKLLDVSMRLEGLTRHASTHAAGVVMSDKPMVEYLPLFTDKKGNLVTQFDKNIVEQVGLVKFDFLGLRTMTVIQDALDLIEEQGKTPPDLDTLSLDDPATYELYSRGDTDGVFQVESSGMRQYLRMLKPSVFEDIIAMLALYRPGPLGSGMVDEFIKRKHGEVEVTYPLESLTNCLRDTYGVIVYQEQVMQIAQIAANYTLGGADLLRRAMGKKSAEAMAAERVKFNAGAKVNGVPESKAKEIFDLMEKFAEYGFNKSHSAAYAQISYFTAYLKVHYPAEFMAAIMTSEMGNQEKVLKYVACCKDMDIAVLPPDVQNSLRGFNVVNNQVIYGLGGIKNVGDEAIREIVEARKEGGEFASLYDMCCRVNLRKVTKRVVEHLIKGGACDCFGLPRAALFAGIDTVVGKAQKKAKEKQSAQVSMFSVMPATKEMSLPGLGIDCPEQKVGEWSDEDKSHFEKDALGFFLSSHPLQPYHKELYRLHLQPLEECRDMAPGQECKCAILVTSIKEFITKKGSKMAFCNVEDLTASGECIFFPEAYAAAKALLEADLPLELTAKIAEPRGEAEESSEDDENIVKDIKLLADSVRLLSDACATNDNPVTIDLPATHLDEESLESLKAMLKKNKGETPVHARLIVNNVLCTLCLGAMYGIQPGPLFDKDFNEWKKAKA